MKTDIRIAIAEDHTVFRQVFMQSLGKVKGLEVVFGAGNGVELIAQLRKNPVDVVLLDLHMPVMDGTVALEVIRSEFPKIKVIILSLQYSDIHVRKFMRLGARGYLCKDVEYDKVVEAIRDVYHFGYFFYDKVSPDLLADLLAENSIDVPIPQEQEPLTTREIEVIQLLLEQYTNQEIAKTLNISVRTVHNHRINITRKTGARNVVGVLIYALKQGLLVVQ